MKFSELDVASEVSLNYDSFFVVVLQVQVSDHHAVQSHPYHQAASAGSAGVKRVPPSALPHYSHTPSHHPMAAAAHHPPPHHLLATTTPGLPFVSQHPLKPGSLDSPRTDPTVPPGHKEHGFNLVGNKYLLLDQLEGSHLQRCIDVQTQQEYVCKVRHFKSQVFISRKVAWSCRTLF